MKKEFFNYLFLQMRYNEDIVIIFAGLGYPRLEEFQKAYPDRAINTEAAEQTALDIAVGMAYAGKIPVVYTITPFLLRGFETIRTYINHEKLNVKMIGAGVGNQYSKHDGFSHEAGDIPEIMATMKNIIQFSPTDLLQLHSDMDTMVATKQPVFFNLPK